MGQILARVHENSRKDSQIGYSLRRIYMKSYYLCSFCTFSSDLSVIRMATPLSRFAEILHASKRLAIQILRPECDLEFLRH